MVLGNTQRSTSRSPMFRRSRSRAEGASSSNRWRSASRTVRGSIDEDGYTNGTNTTKGRRGSYVKGSSSLSPPPPPTLGETRAGQIRNEGNDGVVPHVGAPAPEPAPAKPAASAPPPSPPSPFLARLSKLEKRLLQALPYPVSRFLGYRKPSHPNSCILPVQFLSPIAETWLFAWVGAFVSIGCIALLFSHAYPFTSSPERGVNDWTAPVVVGSFGASSVLLFGSPDAPVGQPWNFFVGQTVSAFSGVFVAKLFALNSRYSYQTLDQSFNIVWLAGGCATATALVLMMMTNSVHPPGGATALLAATTPQVTHLGWRYLVVVMISGGMMLLWALIWMNLGRKRYPAAWVNKRSGITLYDGLEALLRNVMLLGGRGGGATKKHDDGVAGSDVEKHPGSGSTVNGVVVSNGGLKGDSATSPTGTGTGIGGLPSETDTLRGRDPTSRRATRVTSRRSLLGAPPEKADETGGTSTAASGAAEGREQSWQDETTWTHANNADEDEGPRGRRVQR